VQDKRVRQALNLAMDRVGISKTIYNNGELAQPFSVTNPSQPYDIGKVYPVNMADAKKAIDASGIRKGIDVSIWHPAGRYAGIDQMGQVVESNLKELGFNAKLVLQDYNVWLLRVRSVENNYNDGMLLTWATTGQSLSPFVGYTNKWDCSSAYGAYCNSDLDAKMQKAATIFDDKERNAAIKDAFLQLYDEAPGSWMVLLQEPNAYKESVIKTWLSRQASIISLIDLVPA
jgi:ABC-type transport system substrate-binding protein